MKTLISMLVLMLASCVSNPNVTITTPDGTRMRLSTGMNLMAEVDEQVSEVEGGGYHLRHMVKRQDATRVPIAGFQSWVARALGLATAKSTDLKTTTDGAVLLKGTKDPNIIPVDPNVIPANPNVIPFNPN